MLWAKRSINYPYKNRFIEDTQRKKFFSAFFERWIPQSRNHASRFVPSLRISNRSTRTEALSRVRGLRDKEMGWHFFCLPPLVSKKLGSDSENKRRPLKWRACLRPLPPFTIVNLAFPVIQKQRGGWFREATKRWRFVLFHPARAFFFLRYISF